MASPALRAYVAAAAEREEARDADVVGSAGAEAAPLIGKRVAISGLLARPELNGTTAMAVSFNPDSSRYTVVLERADGAQETLALKSGNLTAVASASSAKDATLFSAGARVRICNLTSSQHLNECGGTIVEWNQEKQRYVLELDGSLKKMLLKAANLVRDRRERWAPELPTAANRAHIQREQERYYAEAANERPPLRVAGSDGRDIRRKGGGAAGGWARGGDGMMADRATSVATALYTVFDRISVAHNVNPSDRRPKPANLERSVTCDPSYLVSDRMYTV